MRSPRRPVEGAGQIFAKDREFALDAGRAADHHMVEAGMAALGKDVAGKGPQAPLHPVAEDRIADFPGDGEAGANLDVVIAAIADEQHEAGGCRAPSRVGGEEVGAFADRA